MMIPRRAAMSRPRSYTSNDNRSSSAAVSVPTISRTCAIVMFSSWPDSAFVAGLKTGGSSRALSTSPAGSGSPASVPLARYSFQAEPLR